MYPKPRTRPAANDCTIDPSLLGAVALTRPPQVWRAEITDGRMATGFMSLVAIIDGCSRYVRSWQRSHTRDSACGLEALAIALVHGCPAIFNTAQGVQFTSRAFTSRLARVGVAISMDGRGRALDNIFVDRWWRTVT